MLKGSVNASGTWQVTASSLGPRQGRGQRRAGTYWVVAPVGASGIAFLGDAGKFVSHGDKRIAHLRDDGKVHATVAFAAGEGPVTLHGYAPRKPAVTATATGRAVLTITPLGGFSASVVGLPVARPWW
ncbi:hypothetical protein ACIREM_31385 [Streptomyces shenzhenensis]|uniref:hypothetical protein n=1 Tax=Streptomyces shenzhenensis TaxID=943815 RepID=UPI0037FE1A04